MAGEDIAERLEARLSPLPALAVGAAVLPPEDDDETEEDDLLGYAEGQSFIIE